VTALFWLSAGIAALVVAFVLVLWIARRPSWVVWQQVAGIFLAVLAWKIARAAGAFEDENPEGCSDCGEGELWGLILLVGNIVGWTLGTAAGGVTRFVLRRPQPR